MSGGVKSWKVTFQVDERRAEKLESSAIKNLFLTRDPTQIEVVGEHKNESRCESGIACLFRKLHVWHEQWLAIVEMHMSVKFCISMHF